MSIDEIRTAVFQLPEIERAQLAQEITTSLNSEEGVGFTVESDPEFIEEILRRSDLIREDPSQLRDWRESAEKIREKLRERASQR